MNDEIAKELKDAYQEQIEDFNGSLVGVLRNGFEMSNDEVYVYLQDNEKEAYDFCIAELK